MVLLSSAPAAFQGAGLEKAFRTFASSLPESWSDLLLLASSLPHGSWSGEVSSPAASLLGAGLEITVLASGMERSFKGIASSSRLHDLHRC